MSILRKWKRLLFGCMILSIPPIMAACSNPAGAPAPPLEIPAPAVLKFVDFNDLRVDVGSISASASASLNKAIAAGEDITQLVIFGPELNANVEEAFLQPAFSGISTIDIPTVIPSLCYDATTRQTDLACLNAYNPDDPTTYDALDCYDANNALKAECMATITYEVDIVFQNATGHLAGTEARNVKLDFAGFDANAAFNLTGTNQVSCSGNAADFPVCVLFWLDDERYVAWLFLEAQAETDGGTTIGEGHFKLFLADFEGYDTGVAYHYTQLAAQPEERSVDTFARGIRLPNASCAPGVPLCLTTQQIDFHLLADELLTAFDTLQKTINLHSVVDVRQSLQEPVQLVDAQYIGQFIEDFDFWSGSLANSSGVDESNLCARLERNLPSLEAPFTAFAVPPEGWDTCNADCDPSTQSCIPYQDYPGCFDNCSDVAGTDIRVLDTAFIRALADADVALPDDFPETPTF